MYHTLVVEQGAKMVCQIWNCGRISHTDYQPDGRAPPAPSALACPQGECMTMEGPKVREGVRNVVACLWVAWSASDRR